MSGKRVCVTLSEAKGPYLNVSASDCNGSHGFGTLSRLAALRLLQGDTVIKRLSGYRSPLTAYRSPLTAYRLPLTAYRSLFTVSLFTPSPPILTSLTYITSPQ